MLAKKNQVKERDVVIVGESEHMRNALKGMIISNMYKIHEAMDETAALKIALRYNPRIVFVSMEDNQYWPGLVKSLKKRSGCTVVAYSNGITRDAVALAYFAGVDDILVNPQRQRERVEKYLMRADGISSSRYYRFPNQKSALGYSNLKRFFWLQAELF